ncbi:MAG: hypothetical protein AAF228_13595 [Pseudomonadota bacterium]
MAALQLLRGAAKQTHPITKRVGSFEDWGIVVDAVYLATGFDIGALLRNPDTMPEEKYAFSLIVNHWHENRLGKSDFRIPTLISFDFFVKLLRACYVNIPDIPIIDTICKEIFNLN